MMRRTAWAAAASGRSFTARPVKRAGRGLPRVAAAAPCLHSRSHGGAAPAAAAGWAAAEGPAWEHSGLLGTTAVALPLQPQLPVLPLAWLGGLLGRHEGALQCHGHGPPRRPTDYELSLGKIVDTLRSDYPAFFERPPDFSIYDEHVVFELGRPFSGVSALRGKRQYRRALSALQHLGSSAVRDGMVACHVADGTPYGHALRVPWTCRGTMAWPHCPIHISAVSLYSLAPQGPGTVGGLGLSHRIHRHAIEFVEIQPPSLRSLLLRLWWHPQSQIQPVMALWPP